MAADGGDDEAAEARWRKRWYGHSTMAVIGGLGLRGRPRSQHQCQSRAEKNDPSQYKHNTYLISVLYNDVS